MNKPMIRKLIRHLSALPESRYMQDTYFYSKVTKQGHLCGTRACIAGHAVIMERAKKFCLKDVYEPKSAKRRGFVCHDDIDVNFRVAAQEILGLTDKQCDRLFDSYPNDKYEGNYENPGVADAIKALRNLLDNPNLNPWRDYDGETDFD